MKEADPNTSYLGNAPIGFFLYNKFGYLYLIRHAEVSFMEEQEFLSLFKDQFEEPIRPKISMNSKFRKIEGWSSLQALIVTVAIHEKSGVTYSNDDIKNAETVMDLFHILKTKSG